ncbi:MAG: hypothetical protein IJ468_12435 [Lachnospiraceae bacterium]|nr:hypothetical protein [Lachnospiraceae bacterium]
MNQKYLAILEVSQKQVFIFFSNKLKENVINSAIIAWVTSSVFFETITGDPAIYSEEKNLVYAGGGHTVLVFDSLETAKEFISKVTLEVRKSYEGLELFAKILPCEDNITSRDLELLSKALEEKKAKRASAFHQRSFGVEKTVQEYSWKRPEMDVRLDQELTPDGFEQMNQLEKLGGTKGESNFVAIIHIDGNNMGKRVEELRRAMEGKDWEELRLVLREFSDAIDQDFKAAYREMTKIVAEQLIAGKLEQMSLLEYAFPVRRVITAGDDICFITEGRIGLECAVLFLKKLAERVNHVDHKGYAACAGVAIVHQKYPFYRAYELAEDLCSNAKRYIATYAQTQDKTEASGNVCTIDWHIEYGEMKDSLEEIREMYKTSDGNHLELRPYIVLDPRNYMNEPVRTYANLKKQILKLTGDEMDYARGKLKEMRAQLRNGEEASKYYLQVNRMEDLVLDTRMEDITETDIENVKKGKRTERNVFEQTADGKKRALLFDAIEIMDTYLLVEG